MGEKLSTTLWFSPRFRSQTDIQLRSPTWGSTLDSSSSKPEIWKEKNSLSNEKRAPGCLVYIGDEILPSYIGIIKNYYKDPYYDNICIILQMGWSHQVYL